MKRLISIAFFLTAAMALMVGLTAWCDNTAKVTTHPADPMAELNQPEPPREVRPPPAKSGLGANPSDPNGLPGPSGGLGTSSNRY
jgi:hypothetical protein